MNNLSSDSCARPRGLLPAGVPGPRMLVHLQMIAVVLMGIAVPAAGQNIEAEAYSGHPFGVGRIVFDQARPVASPHPAGATAVRVREVHNRVYYPVAGSGTMPPVVDGARRILGRARRPALRILGELLPRDTKRELYFLFQGTDPLELTVDVAPDTRLVVVPRNDPQRHGEVLHEWWKHFARQPGPLLALLAGPQGPQHVKSYLELMLARRLRFPLPVRRTSHTFEKLFAEELGLAVGSEKLLVDLFAERFRGAARWREPAELQLPEPVAVPQLAVPPPSGHVEVEPIALRVPAECFYVRFARFNNFLWAQDFVARFGGDLQNLVALRGLRYDGARRIEESLVLRQSALSRLFGEAVVADVALVGTDLFFHDGGSFGLLFEAQNNTVLAADLKRQRAERIAGDSKVTEKRFRIGQHEVSLLSSADGRVRSYYAAAGKYHFVTRSRYLVERFLQSADGTGSLGATDEFRYARSVFPLSRNDTVFVYLSDAFWRNFTGPRYRIETMRRLQAAADIKLVELARLAAGSEGRKAETIEQLVAAGLLPPGFGPRPDGTETVLLGERVFDSHRGPLGSFLPVPDVPVVSATRHELDKYAAFAGHYMKNWERLDPVVVAVGRESLDSNSEHVVIDLRMMPLSKGNYRRVIRRLGPADTVQMAPVPGDAIAGEVVLRSGRVFGALRALRLPASSRSSTPGLPASEVGPGDDTPLAELAHSALAVVTRQFHLRDLVVGYVGTTGELGPLWVLNVGIPDRSDPAGLARGPTGMWRARHGPLTVFSFQPEVLAEVMPRLRVEQADEPAHLRLRVDDVSKSPAVARLNRWAFDRARRTTVGNLQLLDQLEQQLHVPPEKCREVAEQLLAARLRCPLGGNYVLRRGADGRMYWTTTALKGSEDNFRPAAPAAEPKRGNRGRWDPERRDAGDGRRSDSIAGAPFQRPGDPTEHTATAFVDVPQAGFVAPPFDWFRGLQARARATPEALIVHVELLVRMPERRTADKQRGLLREEPAKRKSGSFLGVPIPGLPALRPADKKP